MLLLCFKQNPNRCYRIEIMNQVNDIVIKTLHQAGVFINIMYIFQTRLLTKHITLKQNSTNFCLGLQ